MHEWVHGKMDFVQTLPDSKRKRTEKTAPPEMYLMRSQVIHQAAQSIVISPSKTAYVTCLVTAEDENQRSLQAGLTLLPCLPAAMPVMIVALSQIACMLAARLPTVQGQALLPVSIACVTPMLSGL